MPLINNYFHSGKRVLCFMFTKKVNLRIRNKSEKVHRVKEEYDGVIFRGTKLIPFFFFRFAHVQKMKNEMILNFNFDFCTTEKSLTGMFLPYFPMVAV